jgi:pyruvate-formate lyase-activating enzyme
MTADTSSPVEPMPDADVPPLSEEDAQLLAKLDANLAGDILPMFQVSGVCNLKCVMCGGAQDLVPGRFMDTSLFERLCRDLWSQGMHSIIIAGAYGEPFLHPDIFHLLEFAKRLGFHIILSTNGNALDDAGVDRLAALELAHIQFSFAGWDQDSYSQTYKGGDFDLARRTLARLAKALRLHGKTELLVNGVLTERDADAASRIRALLLDLGVHDTEIKLIPPHNFGGQILFPPKTPDRAGTPPTQRRRAPVCQVLSQIPGILWDGRVTACGCLDHKGLLQIGHVDEASLVEMRAAPPFRRMVDAFRRADLSTLPLCETCNVPFGVNADLP